jgi:Protein of unknown function (DUF2795)
LSSASEPTGPGVRLAARTDGSANPNLEEDEMAVRAGRSPANIAKHLKGISFPAKQPDLVEHTRKQKAEPEVIELLEKMPDRDYGNMADVMKGVGEVN